MVLRDFNGNVLKRDDTVVFANGKGKLLSGKIDCLQKDNVGVISERSAGNITYWRKENELVKIIEIPQEEKIYIKEDTYPIGCEPECVIHEDEKGTYYLKDDVNEWRKEKYNSPKLSKKRIQNIIDAVPGVKWDPLSIKVTIKGWGDRPAFTMMGHILTPINGKIVNVTWHTNTPGGGTSRMYVWYKGKNKRFNANLSNGKRVLEEIIKLLKEEKTS